MKCDPELSSDKFIVVTTCIIFESDYIIFKHSKNKDESLLCAFPIPSDTAPFFNRYSIKIFSSTVGLII